MGYPISPADAIDLEDADRLLLVLEGILAGRCPGRFWRGLMALYKARQEFDALERLYLVARALEALAFVQPLRGDGVFADRCKRLVSNRGRGAALFKNLYLRRSSVAHSNAMPPLEPVDGGDLGDTSHVDDESVEAEIVVGEVFRTILARPKLLKRFETDESIAAFGPPIDVAGLRSANEVRWYQDELSA